MTVVTCMTANFEATMLIMQDEGDHPLVLGDDLQKIIRAGVSEGWDAARPPAHDGERLGCFDGGLDEAAVSARPLTVVVSAGI